MKLLLEMKLVYPSAQQSAVSPVRKRVARYSRWAWVLVWVSVQAGWYQTWKPHDKAEGRCTQSLRPAHPVTSSKTATFEYGLHKQDAMCYFGSFRGGVFSNLDIARLILYFFFPLLPQCLLTMLALFTIEAFYQF